MKKFMLSILGLLCSISYSYSQTISTIAGTGSPGFSGDNGQATLAQINLSRLAVAVDSSGNILLADANNHRIRKIDALTGIITTIAGTGVSGFTTDGSIMNNTKALWFPTSITIDKLGNLYFAELGNVRIRKIDAATGIITTIAGTGTQGLSGDNGLAINAQIGSPEGIAINQNGDIFYSDNNLCKVRKIDALSGIITTVAGIGVAGFSGDGGQATLAKLQYPRGVSLDNAGNIYICDANNSRIRKIDALTGIIKTFAGTGFVQSSGDGGLATQASFGLPSGIVFDANTQSLYFSDAFYCRIRKINLTTGIITTVSGIGSGSACCVTGCGFSGDNGPANLAMLKYPYGLALDKFGNLYVSDELNYRVRKISTGTIPIKLTSFTGQKVNSKNLLQWKTVFEQNNKGFFVERSSDGVNFSNISFVNTKAINGNSSFELSYDFSDEDITNRTYFYYRLKQIDFDGKGTFSNIVIIHDNTPSKKMVLYPNPVRDRLCISVVSAKQQSLTLKINDVAGKTIFSEKVALSKGANTLRLSMSMLGEGIYFLELDGFEIKKIIKD